MSDSVEEINYEKLLDDLNDVFASELDHKSFQTNRLLHATACAVVGLITNICDNGEGEYSVEELKLLFLKEMALLEVRKS